MGEQVKKVEEVKVEDLTKEEAPAAALEAVNKEAATAQGGEENKEATSASNELLPPPPQPPVILGIDLHCTGCSNKITRCILRCKGVEGVEVDMAKNMVTVKGVVNPYDICDRLRKRTMRNAMVISPTPPPPPPPPPAAAEKTAAPKEEPVIIHSQVNEVRTVELLVNMHCETCAQQLHSKILKMRGVHSAEANLNTGKINVTGTMSTDSLVQYIHRRTGKLATVVEPTMEKDSKEDGLTKTMESQEEIQEKPSEDSQEKKDTAGGENKEKETGEVDVGASGDDGKKAQTAVAALDGLAPPEEMTKRMMYWPNPYKHYHNLQADGETVMDRMMPILHPYPKPMMMPWMTQVPSPTPSPMLLPPPPMYHYNYDTVERHLPPPQYFSDENPNACVIS